MSGGATSNNTYALCCLDPHMFCYLISAARKMQVVVEIFLPWTLGYVEFDFSLLLIIGYAWIACISYITVFN